MRWIDNAVDPSITLLKGYTVQRSNYRIFRKGGTPNWLLIYTMSGAGRVTLGGIDYRVDEGQIVFIAPGIDHDYGIPNGAAYWEQLWFHWVPSPAYENLLRQVIGRDPVQVVEVSDRRATEEMLKSAVEADPGAFGTLLSINRLEAFLLSLQRPEASSTASGKVSAALEFISRNYAKELSVEQVSSAVGLSSSRLNGLFRQELGVTPRQAIERERMVQAKLLLRLSSRSIQSISEELGFASPFYFTLRFRKETGLSPSEFRQKA